MNPIFKYPNIEEIESLAVIVIFFYDNLTTNMFSNRALDGETFFKYLPFSPIDDRHESLFLGRLFLSRQQTFL